MNLRLSWSDRAIKDFDALDRPIARRVMDAIDRYLETSAGNVRLLRGRHRELRLRVGDWRVRFTLGSEPGVMYILSIRHRREAYRRR